MGTYERRQKKSEGSSMDKRQIKKQIIEEVDKIDNIWMLQQIWMMIQNIKR